MTGSAQRAADAVAGTAAAGLVGWARAVLARDPGQGAPPAPSHRRLDHLAEVLGLAPAPRDLLAFLYGIWLLPEDPPVLTAARAAHLLGGTVGGARSRAPLAAWDLLREAPLSPTGGLALALDETIGDWLSGGDPLPPGLRERVTIRRPLPPVPGWPVEETAGFIMRALNAAAAAGPAIVEIEGIPGSGRRSFAGAVGAAIGAPPLIADLSGLGAGEAHTVARLVDRAAMLAVCPVAWIGAEGFEVPEGRPGFPVQFDIRTPGGTGIVRPSRARRRVRLGALPPAARDWAWTRLVPGAGDWPADGRRQLAAARAATIGDIARAAALVPEEPAAAALMLREDQRARLDTAVRPMAPAFSWSDLILPERTLAALRRFATEAGMRDTLWEEPGLSRLFPQGRGVFALFSGASGTGKTMAAQVIAAELGVDLHVVDAAAITSKYVGETSQNLQRVLAQAETQAALLFFDEADGLFGKRTDTRDAHDRYVNADTNVLLQAVEAYSGACILATNRRDNLDSAFTRRLRYAIDFPRPDAGLRRRLWLELTVAMAGEAALALQPACEALAAGLDLTGAQIKNAVLTALIASRAAGRQVVTPADLIEGADQEMMKEGRALSAAEAGRLAGNAGR